MAHSYKACTPTHAGSRSCFELLGFDILIDKKFKPYLLEVNHAPSFNDDTEVDKQIKTGLITDTLRLLDITYAHKARVQDAHRRALEGNQPGQKKRAAEEVAEAVNVEEDEEAKTYEKYQMENLGDYERIYPFPHTDTDGSTEE